MTNDSVEQQLRELGQEWPPNDSFVDSVISRVDSEPRLPKPSATGESHVMRFRYLTVGAILLCIGLWAALGPQSTGSVLYAQVKEALKQVQTIHQVMSVQTDDGSLRTVVETWFARGRGFAVISDEQIRIDNGTYFWEHKKGSDTALRTKSQSADELLDQALNIREKLDRNCERFRAGDRSIDGVEHECYRLLSHGAAKPAGFDSENRREFVFISPKSLLKRAEAQRKVEGEWKTHVVRTWEYDVPVAPHVFEPQFGEGVSVIKVDEEFEKLTTVENAVHTEQREGLIYTIHQAKRFENGGIMIMASVRGTDETLKEFPLTRRMLQPGLYITDGPATNWQASPQGSGYFRLKLAEANHQGVDAQWWMMVPRGRKPNWFEADDGLVQLKIGITPRGEFAKANHTDERGVTHHINWDLAIDIPKPERLPSLSEMSEDVLADLRMLSTSGFHGTLHLGVKDVDGILTQQHGTAEDVSPEQFTAATQNHLRWWENNDVDFQLTKGATGLGAMDGDEIGASGMKPAVMVDYYSAVDDKTLAQASERSDLVAVSVRGTMITDAGLAYLTGLKNLKRLNVADTLVTDDSLRHFQAMKSLQHLNVTGTRMTQTGVDKLRKALPDALIMTSNTNTNKKLSEKVERPAGDQPPLPASVTGIVIDSDDQPVADARVTVLIRRFSKETDGETDGPGPWTAVTDAKGHYSISPTGSLRPSQDEVRVKVVAEGFADQSGVDYKKKILKGVLPRVRMLPGRKIKGRLVDSGGKAVAKAIVRFQSCNADATANWDSGPFPVDTDGRFSLSIPSTGTAAGAVYPTGFAPRFVDVTSETDQGNIALEQGVSLKGRLVDRDGKGIAKTVVGIRKTEHRIIHLFVAVIGTAVRTDEAGYFQLPALQGAYKLSVGRSVPDYSKQMMLDGEQPPAVEPVTFEFDRSKLGESILLREQTQ